MSYSEYSGRILARGNPLFGPSHKRTKTASEDARDLLVCQQIDDGSARATTESRII